MQHQDADIAFRGLPEILLCGYPPARLTGGFGKIVMNSVLNPDEVIDAARLATGLDDFDGASFREGLEVICRDISRDTDRPEDVRARNRGDMIRFLSDRLKVIHAWKERPEIGQQEVKSPVFVLGIPRTGTTLLHNLLSADPGRRSLLTWEITHVVPPPTTETLYTDPRALAMIQALEEKRAKDPSLGKYYRLSPIYPHEDVFILAHDFKTTMWEAYGKVPEYRDWIYQADVTSAYAHLKKFLQLHQFNAPGTWVLKAPSHILNLRTLLRVFPDARLVWPHRDPLAAVGSFCSLTRHANTVHAGRADLQWIGENCSWQAAEHASRAMDFLDEFGKDRIIHVHYADMIRDPIGTVRQVYQALGDDFTPAAEAGIGAWVADNPQGKFGKHEYKLAEFGLSQTTLEPMFDRYLNRYNIETEG